MNNILKDFTNAELLREMHERMGGGKVPLSTRTRHVEILITIDKKHRVSIHMTRGAYKSMMRK